MGTRGSVTSLRRSRFWKMVAMLGGMAVIASVGITACHDGVVAPTEALSVFDRHQDATGPLSLDNVGAYHNQFLDFAFPSVKAAARGGADRDKLCKVLVKAMRDFVTNRKLGVDPASITETPVEHGCAAKIARSKRNGPRFYVVEDGTPSPEADQIAADIAYAAAENLPLADLSSYVDQKVAYARSILSQEEADAVAAAAAVALSSTEYWDANYASQEQQLREMQAAYTRQDFFGAGLRRNSSTFAAPNAPLSDTWLTRIRESSWYPRARKVVGYDLKGALRGAIKGIPGGWSGIGAGAVVEGGISSGGGLIDMIFAQ